MTLELVPLATMAIELDAPFVLEGTPSGARYIFEVAGLKLEGERCRATLKGRAAADWLTVGPDGTGTIDVRMLLETHDGALVFMQYNGRIDVSPGGNATAFATPRFETGDDRYGWLNKIQTVAKGTLDGSTLTYELYELK